MEINSNQRFTAISCGDDFAAAISSKKKLWMWGCNRFGKIGVGHKNDMHTPTLVQFRESCDVVRVSCGKDHVACIVSDGDIFQRRRVFAWGRNQEG